MRLDGLGKPTLVQPVNSESAKVQEKSEAQVTPVTSAPETGTSSSQNQGAKLGQILHILEKAKEKAKAPKKKIPQKVAMEAIRVYQRQMLYDEGEGQVGQTLDLKG